MKKMIIIAACSLMATVAQAQEKADTLLIVERDSAKAKEVPKERTSVNLGNIIVNVKRGSSTVSLPKNKSSFSMGLVFDHFDLGFSRYLDKGSFTLAPTNSFLEFEPAKTSHVGFDFFEMKYKSGSKFAFYIAAGLDWNHIRLKQDITIQKDQSQLTAVPDNVEFSKNRFSSRYLRLPIGIEFNMPVQKGTYFRVVAGPEFGFLMNGKLKQLSKERGKEKFKDDYNFNPFRYGAHLRLAYQNTGIYVKYYFNDVFAKGQGPSDFKNMSFGLTWGF